MDDTGVCRLVFGIGISIHTLLRVLLRSSVGKRAGCMGTEVILWFLFGDMNLASDFPCSLLRWRSEQMRPYQDYPE